MAFQIPSTPNKRSLQSQPSTTPAGAPPSYLTNKSTTPSGPPPRSHFDSSYNPSNNTFGSRGYNVPEFEDDDDVEYDYNDDVDLDGAAILEEPAASRANAFMSSLPASHNIPRGQKRSRDGKIREGNDMEAIARSMINRSQPAPLKEDGKVMVQSDALVGNLDRAIQNDSSRTEQALGDLCARTTELWGRFGDSVTKPGAMGPLSEDPFSKATYLASLLLQLHYPHAQPDGKFGDIGSGRAFRDTLGKASHLRVPVPRALLSWLDTYHLPFPDDFDMLYNFRPSPSAHESYWDILFASALRGKLPRVIQLLRHARWENAFTAQDDGSETDGYNGIQLENTQEVAARAVNVLGTCPGLDGDWDVKNNDWTLFRVNIMNALHDLETFAGAGLTQTRSRENMFQSSMEGSTFGLSTASRRAESRVPWSVYENLTLVYKLLLGKVEDILLTAQDWLEASIYVAIWWDGSEDDNPELSLRKSGMSKSGKARPREVDIAPLAAYRRRLGDAFSRVTADPIDSVFAVNTIDIVQVGLACILEENVATAVNILRTLSMPVTVSVVEIASTGAWLPLARPSSRGHLLGQGFSKEDLLVLSHAPDDLDPKGIDRDNLLSEYASLLAKKSKIDGKEGWELAIAVLSREENSSESTKQIGALLNSVPLTDETSVNRVLTICDSLSLAEQRVNIAERYADSLAESESPAYGLALVYYARAQATVKLRRTLELLTSLSLLHSASVPSEIALDAKLKSLVSRERIELKALAAIDLEAATLLSSNFSGYATLRTFYDLRDQGVDDGIGSYPTFKSLERRRRAATALFTVIQSAADCIPGGLYDHEVESVVSVEGLLALFGEALPLLGQKQRIFTQRQVFGLLAVVEDYVAAPTRVHEDARSLLAASLSAYVEESGAVPSSLKKSKSDLSNSSDWDMVASQSIIIQSAAGDQKVKFQRAWVWRKGLVAVDGISASGAQVVKLLREALAREVANGWAGMLKW